MLKGLLPCILLFAVAASFVAHAQQNCCSSLTVSVVSTDTRSIDGFSIKLDGRNIGVTDDYGYLPIMLSGISKGRHRIQAVKQEEDGVSFAGMKDINIPCINASVGCDCPVTVEVFRTQGRSPG